MYNNNNNKNNNKLFYFKNGGQNGPVLLTFKRPNYKGSNQKVTVEKQYHILIPNATCEIANRPYSELHI